MKRLTIIIFVIAIALASVGIVAAQDPPPPNQNQPGDRLPGEAIEIIAEATGLMPRDIVTMSRDEGKTLADIITENGGDLDAITAEINTLMTDRINEARDNANTRADEAIANLDERIGNLLNQPMPDRPAADRVQDRQDNRQDILGGIIRELADVAGLEPQAIREELQGGATIAEIAGNNGIDVNTLIATVTSAAEERLSDAVDNERLTQEEADERLAQFTENLTNAVNTPLPTPAERRVAQVANRSLVQAALDELDIQLRDVPDLVEEGQTWAEFITANGGSVENVIAAATANVEERLGDSDLSPEEVEALLASAVEHINEILNNPAHPNRVPRR